MQLNSTWWNVAEISTVSLALTTIDSGHPLHFGGCDARLSLITFIASLFRKPSDR